MIELQSRDQDILKVCYEQQFLVAEHLMRHQYFGCHRSEAYRRLSELVNAGYLRPFHPFKGSRKFLYQVTKKGLEEARKVSEWDLRVRRPNLNNLEHDICLTLVRYRFRSTFWFSRWKPEGVLRAEYGRKFSQDAAIGDGLIQFLSGNTIAVELELSLKNRERYRRIFANWDKSPLKPVLVLYVAGTKEIASGLKRYLMEQKNLSQPFGIVTKQSFL